MLCAVLTPSYTYNAVTKKKFGLSMAYDDCVNDL